jgi:signal recognition particle receptor subunit beta
VKAEPSLAEYREFLDMSTLRVPILPVDARKREDVVMLIETLLSLKH